MASCKFYGILKIQESTSVVRGPVDVGVYNLTSSLEITVSGLKGTKSVPRKPARTFSSPKVAKNAA